MTVTELSQKHREFLMSRGGSARTGECYRLTVSQFIEYLRQQGLTDDVREFTPENIEGFISYMVGHGISANSMNVKLAGLASLGRFGTRRKDARNRYILAENPVSRVDRPKRQKKVKRFLYVEELRKLLGLQCACHEHLAVAFLVDTALRVSEIVDAKVSDLSEAGDRLKLTVRVKGGAQEELLLGREFAAKLLESLKFREARGDDPLIVTSSGRGWNRSGFSELILRLAKRAGVTRIPVRAHVLRHSIATLAGELGTEVPAVAGMLNHNGIATVSTYVHSRSARVDEARDRVREAIRG